MIEFLKRLFAAIIRWAEEEVVAQQEPIVVEEKEEEPTLPSPQDNIKAFLDMIAFAEGTINLGDNGYNVIVGGRLFYDYTDHPRDLVKLPRYGISSTAAGRYQILSRFWDHYKAQLRLPDFGPDSQDKYAIQQIKERRAYNDVRAGRISAAIEKCGNIWASFPTNNYGQRQVGMDTLLKEYVKFGGSLCQSDQEKYNVKTS